MFAITIFLSAVMRTHFFAPALTAGHRFTFTWVPPHTHLGFTEHSSSADEIAAAASDMSSPPLSAREHADLVFQQVARLMRDTSVFAQAATGGLRDDTADAAAGAGSSCEGGGYGSVADVRGASSVICRLLFRVYAHIYHSHTPIVRRLGLQVRVTACIPKEQLEARAMV
jgi:hypothetical protein